MPSVTGDWDNYPEKDMEESMKRCLLKNITVTIETADGMKISSTFCMPEYREKDSPNSPFKKMPKSPVKWFKELLSRYHNL